MSTLLCLGLLLLVSNSKGCVFGTNQDYPPDRRCFYLVNTQTGAHTLRLCPDGTLFDPVKTCQCVIPYGGVATNSNHDHACESLRSGSYSSQENYQSQQNYHNSQSYQSHQSYHTSQWSSWSSSGGSSSQSGGSNSKDSIHKNCLDHHSYYTDIYNAAMSENCHSAYHYAKRLQYIATQYGNTVCLHSLIDRIIERQPNLTCSCSPQKIHLNYEKIQNTKAQYCVSHSHTFKDIMKSTFTNVHYIERETQNAISCQPLSFLMEKLHHFKYSRGYDDYCMVDYMKHLYASVSKYGDPCSCSHVQKIQTTTKQKTTTKVSTTPVPTTTTKMTPMQTTSVKTTTVKTTPMQTTTVKTTLVQTTVSPTVTIPLNAPCVDIDNCSVHGPSICGGSAAYAKLACRAYCGFCTPPSTTAPKTTTTTKATTTLKEWMTIPFLLGR